MSAMASDLFLVLMVLALLPRAPTTVLSQSSNLCATKANGRFFCPDCSTTASNRGARFEANHLRLQASLQAMPAANASFLKATFAGGDDTDTVYGLAMCFADANWSDCEDCLTAAAAELVKNRCFSRRDMVVWYPACLVRYDNSSFFGAADTSPARRFDVPNPNSFPDPARLNASGARLAARMIAVAEASQDRYAFDVEEITANDTLHGLAQCMEDLPAEECSRCLASYMGWLAGCCAVMEGVRLIGPSCYMRYELMGFVPGTLPSMAPLPESPPAAPVSPPSVPIGNASSRKRIIRYIIAGISSLLVLCLLVLATFLCYKKHHGSLPWNRGSKNTPRIKSFLQNQHPKRYTYSEVKRMTKSFAHKLGQGGNGVVYKGSLPDGREVAVKMLKESKGDSDEFINEVSSISRTSHVNVVTLLGFCLQGSKRGLVYEYMPNGSLEKHAFGEGNSLSWEKLFDIAVGIVRGLEYLHRGCNTRIVHFDIKPHNILLDRDFHPKISDFGLAKLCPQKESTVPLSIVGARGTVGYMAPEVFSRQVGLVTSKSDVYSYGMVVLGMVGARKGINVVNSETSSKYFPQCLYEELDQFCASACEIDGEATELVRKMAVIGLWCIQINPTDRPSMSRVVEMLESSTAELQLPPNAS